MSQRSVELIIGRLATDEAFRRRFLAQPAVTLEDLRQRGCELTPVEIDGLLGLDVGTIDGLAGTIDPRLQKLDFGSV